MALLTFEIASLQELQTQTAAGDAGASGRPLVADCRLSLLGSTVDDLPVPAVSVDSSSMGPAALRDALVSALTRHDHNSPVPDARRSALQRSARDAIRAALTEASPSAVTAAAPPTTETSAAAAAIGAASGSRSTATAVQPDAAQPSAA
ncbi:hypothetical protein PLESTM_000910300 [Pleodorina starrii]|nr:hypothetical protein PLESTM_000910300 [Pleodorina starrii]